jgi:small-conductance mechanosensitive channel
MKWWTQVSKAIEPVDLLAALGVAFGAWIVLVLAARYGRRILAHVAQRTGARWGDLLSEALARTSKLLMLVVALYLGSGLLDLPARLERLFALAAVMALLLQAGLWVNRLIGRWIQLKVEASRAREPEGATALSLLAFGARVALWSLIALLALDQLGFDITALVAGLGIGGVAVALAVQNVLGDLFASLSIVLDKPFVVGDFIVVDALRGTVERVGIKSTHVRSLDGELLVFSNADLLKSRIRNFKRMQERRIQFAVGVTYQTPAGKLREIPRYLKAAVEAQPGTRHDRAHFKEFGNSALVFEVVYYVLDSDFNVYMNVQQAVNLAILETFAREGIEFAYPTRTVYHVHERQDQGAR